MPKIAWAACIVAFFMAGLIVLSALLSQIVILPFALIPLLAGIGILRRRAWSAYGLALYQFAQLLLLPVILTRTGSPPLTATAIASTVMMAALCALFFFAGRSLAATGAKPGWAWPWIGVTAVSTLPLLFVQAFVIPNGSMENTMLIGDRILFQRFPRPAPTRGDIVAFVYPVDRRQTFVKRVIGVPGDRIRISRKLVYRNGVLLSEPYAVHKTEYEDPYRDNFPSQPNVHLLGAGQEMLQKHVVNGEVVVPEERFFVMGDNRDASLDSRYWGFVGSGDLIGRPLFIYDSEDQSTDQIMQGGPVGRRHVRWERFLQRF